MSTIHKIIAVFIAFLALVLIAPYFGIHIITNSPKPELDTAAQKEELITHDYKAETKTQPLIESSNTPTAQIGGHLDEIEKLLADNNRKQEQW